MSNIYLISSYGPFTPSPGNILISPLSLVTKIAVPLHFHIFPDVGEISNPYGNHATEQNILLPLTPSRMSGSLLFDL